MASETSQYAIGEVAALTGVNPVTLRAWQRRYGLLKPERTDKGHRIYSERDVERINDILAWLDKGVSIGQVKGLLITPDTSVLPPYRLEEADALIGALEQLDIPLVRRQLKTVFGSYPMAVVLGQVIEPVQRWLGQSAAPDRDCQRALWNSLLIQLCARRMKSAAGNRFKGAWVVNLDAELHGLAWCHGLLLAERGYRVLVLNESAFPFGLPSSADDLLLILGDHSLSIAQLDEIGRHARHCGSDVRFVGSIGDIHRQWCEALQAEVEAGEETHD